MFTTAFGFYSMSIDMVVSKYYFGGSFSFYQGVTQNRFTIINNDGSIDSGFNFGTGFNNQVTSTYVQSNGKILVGGSFTTYKGLTQNRIARLNTDGSLDSTFDIGTGFNNTVFTIGV